MSKIEFVAASVTDKGRYAGANNAIYYISGNRYQRHGNRQSKWRAIVPWIQIENSRYRLNRDDHNQIFQFFSLPQGKYAYGILSGQICRWPLRGYPLSEHII